MEENGMIFKNNLLKERVFERMTKASSFEMEEQEKRVDTNTVNVYTQTLKDEIINVYSNFKKLIPNEDKTT